MGRCKICGHVNGHADGCPNSGNDLKIGDINNYHSDGIRCAFCQTLNPPGAKKCKRCNASLERSVVQDHEANRIRRGKIMIKEDSEQIQPTQREEADELIYKCPECGYLLRSGSNECPNCRNKVRQKNPLKNEESNQSKVVWNINESEFRIGLCDKNGQISDAKSYTTDDIILGREELFPGNNNISRLHIHITNEDGNWYIEDVSSTHQTFLIVKKKTRIENGDILVLGNKFFCFETE